jgi:hypothetical protein
MISPIRVKPPSAAAALLRAPFERRMCEITPAFKLATKSWIARTFPKKGFFAIPVKREIIPFLPGLAQLSAIKIAFVPPRAL